MEYLCKYWVYSIEILQNWCTARTTHCNSGSDVTIATYLLSDLYLPKMKNALFVATESNRLSCACAVWCPYSLTPFRMTCDPLCYHGNVTMDISWNFVMSVTTVQSFSSIQKKLWEIIHFFVMLYHFVSTMWHHKSSNLHKSKSWITQQPRVPAFFIILNALLNKLIKNFVSYTLQKHICTKDYDTSSLKERENYTVSMLRGKWKTTLFIYWKNNSTYQITF